MLGEHVHLAASAASRALAGDTPAFEAARVALDANSTDLAATIRAVYGSDDFERLWRRHVDFLMSYARGKASRDQAQQDDAAANLTAFATEFGGFVERLTEDRLRDDTLAKLFSDHVGTLRAVIDDLAEKDFIGGYQRLRTAYTHMAKLSEALTVAVAERRPEAVGNKQPDSAAGDLQVIFTRLFCEHASLAAATSAQVLAGDAEASHGAGRALEGNTSDIAEAVGFVYGDAAADDFRPLWHEHVGLYISYARATVAGNRAAQDRSVTALTAYADEIADHLEGLTDGLLRADAVAGLITSHVHGIRDVVNALAAKDFTKAYTALRAVYAHMQMIGDALVSAIADQFPTKYG